MITTRVYMLETTLIAEYNKLSSMIRDVCVEYLIDNKNLAHGYGISVVRMVASYGDIIATLEDSQLKYEITLDSDLEVLCVEISG